MREEWQSKHWLPFSEQTITLAMLSPAVHAEFIFDLEQEARKTPGAAVDHAGLMQAQQRTFERKQPNQKRYIHSSHDVASPDHGEHHALGGEAGTAVSTEGMPEM